MSGKPGVLQSMGLQRVRHNLATRKQPPTNNDSSEIAYFSRYLYSKEIDGITKYYSHKEIVINNYHKASLIDLIDSVTHEFNHAINSIINEIKITDDAVSLRTGLSYINFDRQNINKVKSRSKDIVLEEIINTTQTESIINIINSFGDYKIDNEEISNTLYVLKRDINNQRYQSNAYYFQSYICRELTNNKTFIPTIENLRYSGNVDDIENWFDNITDIRGSYNKIVTLLDELLKDEINLANVKFFKKYKINKIISKSRKVLDIINVFDNNCIYK